MTAPRQIAIGTCLLDLDRGVLLRGGALVPVRAKTFDLLCHLAAHAGSVRTKDDIFAAVWPGVIVSDDALTQTIRDLRKALGPENEHHLRTLSRRGYALDTGQPAVAPDEDAPPRIALFPRDGSGQPPDAGDLLHGLVEETTLALGRYGLVRVVARHSAFRARAAAADPETAARTVSATYFAEIGLHGAEGSQRLSVCLCDAGSGEQVWGETFDLSSDSHRTLPAIVANRIVTRLTHVHDRGEMPASPAVTGNAGAYRHFLRGLRLVRQYGPDVNERARDHFLAALSADPRFALAKAYLALAELLIGGINHAPDDVLYRVVDLCQEALSDAPEEARVHWMLAMPRLYLGQHEAAEFALHRAMALNPGDPDNMALLGYVLTARGRPDEGAAWTERAIDLNPLHPEWYQADLAIAYQRAGRYRDAITRLHMLPRLLYYHDLRIACCHAALGETEAAARHMQRALETAPPDWDPIAVAERTREYELSQDRRRIVEEIERALAIIGR